MRADGAAVHAAPTNSSRDVAAGHESKGLFVSDPDFTREAELLASAMEISPLIRMSRDPAHLPEVTTSVNGMSEGDAKRLLALCISLLGVSLPDS